MSYAYFEDIPVLGAGAEYNLEPGPEPSRATITVLRSEWEENGGKIGADGGTLTLYDAQGTSQDIEHLYVENIQAAAPGEVTITLVDSRILWRDRTYTGILNATMDDGETYLSQTINGDEPWTLKEIITKLTDVLKDAPKGTFKPKVNLSSKLAGKWRNIYRNLNYQVAPAAEAIQGILNHIGGFIYINT